MVIKYLKNLGKYTLELGSVEQYLNEEIEKNKSILISLLDPEKLFLYNVSPRKCAEVAYHVSEAGASANMLGGSVGVSEEMINSYAGPIREIHKEKGLYKPLIGFPAGPHNVARELDAIWFLSLRNSRSPYWIVQAPVLGAPTIKRYGIEPIPMAYVIVEPGGTVGFVGDAMPIPRDKPEIASAYALASQYHGFRWFYLEAGSGVEEPVPNEIVSASKKMVEIRVGTGGGIKNGEQAKEKAASGADFIVMGTKVEELVEKSPQEIRRSIEEVVESIREGAKKRKI